MHEEAIRKADVLIEALGYIRKFHGRFTVIKLGGSVMEDPETLRALLVDVVFMQTVGMRPVVVHGGGKAITAAMEQAGLTPGSCRAGATPTRRRSRSSPGCSPRRSTPTSSGTSTSSAAAPRACTTRPRSSASSAAGSTLPDGNGGSIDLGRVGEVTEVETSRRSRTSAWRASCPCSPRWPRTRTTTAVLNVNADTAAAAVARR